MRLIVLLVVLGACSATQRRDDPLAGAPDTCNRAAYATLVGQPRTALERVLILAEVRILDPETPDDAATRPQRLTFDIDAGGRIAAVRCG